MKIQLPEPIERLEPSTPHAGMTLIELLIGLAVTSILITSSVSGLSTLLAETRMNSHVNSLVHSFHSARQISRVKGTEIAVCKSTNGKQCTANSSWHDGWLIFANLDQDNPPQKDPGETLLEVHESVRPLNISSNRHAFIMRPFGKRSTNGTLVYCDQRGSQSAKAIIVSYTGKPRTSSKDSRGQTLTCTASS
ncbi:MAG: prepilin-type N-terminal cleavage/methylation domain-containing protein [Gammaproteobacteria bacterium]|nr:prepilin-type N-terminal cleavage/methylation domain-containing protein [Gammaproteobacteria bacterium]MCP4091010.1 prepilin-type N-terminal cleavage/methylation domain-containing protein [Gammaproteobacteria bacterium]MCP4277464.1 prepilin-type N-terminal cleavage/methylation domain-containing protein [Gammaproteobacteria bacterium]MCP4831475.1 prepilin-type N-terminal cleavage/methylation domain-containing protein [Gammaproteobacteria bacterium]MCP4927698.1 prepilin-type N-terminal cleavag